MSGRQRRSEFRLIADVFAPLSADYEGAFHLEDDAALVKPAVGCELVVTADALIGGVHFRATDDPGLIARKALRVNLSDLAAMGAVPMGYLLTMALPPEIDDRWIETFADGLKQDQETFAVHMMGGDTVSTSGPLALTITALGQVGEGRALRRAGARVGDDIYVSGTIGDGGLGLAVLKGQLPGLGPENEDYLTRRYHIPEPRLALGQRLSGLAHAVIDVSDGLVADLGHVCETSATGAAIELALVPLSLPARSAVQAAPDWHIRTLASGDDYELLFCAASEVAQDIDAVAADLGLPLTRIGEITAEPGVRVLDEHGERLSLPATGFVHF